MYLMTLVGLVFSVLLLGKVLGVEKVAGVAVILLGVYLAKRAQPLEALLRLIFSGHRRSHHTSRT